MKIPPELIAHSAIANQISEIEDTRGTYVVSILFDGVLEIFHIELEGPTKSSFHVREKVFYTYRTRSASLKGIVPLMRRWHRGERIVLPIDLATVDFV